MPSFHVVKKSRQNLPVSGFCLDFCVKLIKIIARAQQKNLQLSYDMLTTFATALIFVI